MNEIARQVRPSFEPYYGKRPFLEPRGVPDVRSGDPRLMIPAVRHEVQPGWWRKHWGSCSANTAVLGLRLGQFG